MNTTEINVIVDYIYPYITVEESDHSRVISGYMGELWGIIEETLNFKIFDHRNKYIIASTREGKEMLITGEADVMLIPVVVTTTDVDDFDFSIPVAKTWYEIYVKRSGELGATSESYLEAWSSSLWAAFILTIFELSVILWLMMKVRKYFAVDKEETISEDHSLSQWSNHNEGTNDEDNQIISLDDKVISFVPCFLIVLGAITLQGFSITTKTTSLRIIVLVIVFFGLLMLNSYSAVLVSRLAVERVNLPFPTLDSVSDQKTHVLCVRETSYAFHLFKENETSTELLPAWKPIVNQPPCVNTTTVQDIGNALCRDRTIVLETPHIIASIAESQKCPITRMPGRYATAWTSLLMRRNFKFKKNINELLQKFLTNGIIDYLQKKWLFKRVPSHSSTISSNKAVTIHHIKGIILVYGISVGVSLVVLLLEKCLHWRRNRRLITLEYVN